MREFYSTAQDNDSDRTDQTMKTIEQTIAYHVNAARISMSIERFVQAATNTNTSKDN